MAQRFIDTLETRTIGKVAGVSGCVHWNVIREVQAMNEGSEIMWSGQQLATAHHEAGHVALLLRHGRSAFGICLDRDDPNEGFYVGPTWRELFESADSSFEQGGVAWHHWKGSAFIEASVCLAGPCAELLHQGKPVPKDFCFHTDMSEYHAGDVLYAKEVLLKWQSFVPETARRSSLQEQCANVQQYVESSLADPVVKKAIADIVELIEQGSGIANSNELEAVPVARTEVPAELLDWP